MHTPLWVPSQLRQPHPLGRRPTYLPAGRASIAGFPIGNVNLGESLRPPRLFDCAHVGHPDYRR